MTTKVKVIIAVVALATAFATGRFTCPTKVKTVTQIQIVEKKAEEDKSTTVNTDHKKVVIVKETHPDGSTKTTTTITDDSKTNTATDDTKTDQTTTNETQTREVTREVGKLNVSVLAGTSFTHVSGVVYGASVTRPLFGPITAGAWGLTNGTGGLSVGLNF